MKVPKSQIKTISRLSSQAVFDCLRKTKELRWVSPSLVVQAQVRTDDSQPFGLCVSTSKRTAPRAVDRNRMRRRLKPIVQDVLTRAGKPGMDYMISCRSPVLTLTPEALEKDLRWCLRKMGLLVHG